MRPEVGQQRMTNPAHGGCPCLQSKRRIDAQTEELNAFFIKLLQRTVESRSLIGSSTGEGEGKGVQNDPLAAQTRETDFLSIVAAQREVGCGSAGF